MKQVANILPLDGQAVINRLQATPPPSESLNGFEELMVLTWRTLEAWKMVHSPVGSTEYNAWKRELKDMSKAELKQGLSRAKTFEGFFDLRAFLKLCKVTAESLGLPDTRKAYLEACNSPRAKDRHHWTHPIVYHAGSEAGWFNLQNLPESQSFPLFRNAYEQLVNRVLAGESLEAPVVKALSSSTSRPLTKEQNRERLNAMREAMGL